MNCITRPAMLSVEQCRTLLGMRNLSDEQVAEIRDALYCFGHLLVEEFIREKCSPVAGIPCSALQIEEKPVASPAGIGHSAGPASPC